MTRIAIVGPSYPFRGGIAQHTTLLARALAARDEVALYSFRRQYPRWLFPGRTDHDDSEQALRFPGARPLLSFDDPLGWVRVGTEIRRRRFDVMILPWWVAFWAPLDLLLLPAVRRQGGPKAVLVCHNVLAHESARVKAWLSRVVLRRADAFVVHASSEEQNLRRIVGERPVLRAFLPSSFPAEIAEGSRLPEELQPPGPNETVILFFGFVRPYKGLETLLRAMPRVLESRPVTLWVVGEFWGGRDRHDRIVEELGLGPHVRIVDRYVGNEEVAACFRSASAVVQPYRSATGSGIAPVAFDLGVPVVATQVGSLADIIRDGETGRLAPPGDENALARAILETLDEETNARFRAAIRAEAGSRSWERLAEQVGTFLEGLR